MATTHPTEGYNICGALTKSGAPCRQRRQWDSTRRESIPCSMHQSTEYKAELAERAAARAERPFWAPRTGGSPYRTDLPESVKAPYFTLIDPTEERFATGVEDKRNLLAAAPEERKLILVWTGQWRSDAFAITVVEAKNRMK